MTENRYIFLDIDGPLNTGRNDYMNPDKYGHHFDDEAVQNLRAIIEETSARIVISSSWRHVGVDKLRELWRKWRLPGKIISFTPGSWGEETQYATRGEEIQAWLQDNAIKPYSYVIIDDMGPEESAPGQEDKWITVNPHCGITQRDSERAISILMSRIKAKVFRIARARDVDGPGIRTLVGFCGCPLNCAYCLNKEALNSREGKWYSPESLLQELQMDDMYFQSTGGGITFGGGEPALQSEFIARFREICPQEWTIALESSFNVPQKHIEDLLDVIDYWYIDIKDMNPEIYERYTGKDSTQMKDNLHYLIDHGKKGEIIARVPLIDGYNTKSDQGNSCIELLELHIMPELFEYTPTSRERIEIKTAALQGELIDEDTPINSWLEPEMGVLLSPEGLRELGKNVSLDDNDWD